MSAEPLVILLAEDDDGHAVLVQRNLRRGGVANEVVRVADGQAALDYARSEGAHAGRARNGVEALRRLKADEATKRIPVIMLTTTDDPREVERCYRLGCSVYITKPVEYDRFVEAIKQLGLFLQVAKVPAENEGGA